MSFATSTSRRYRPCSGRRYAPATVNKALSAIRQVLRHAWLLDQVSGQDYDRARAVPNVKGSRLPAGRALDGGELAALFAACADGSNAGARDAAAFALMFGCGLRRAEAVSRDRGRLRHGDRRATDHREGRQGTAVVYATNGGAAAIAAWLAIRGDAPGAILSPVSKSGKVTAGASDMSAQAIVKRLRVRSGQARIATCSPHDLRRSFVSSALGSGADLAMVQRLAGHASPTTTARYDRRPEEAGARGGAVGPRPLRRGVDSRTDRGPGFRLIPRSRSTSPTSREVGGVPRFRGAPSGLAPRSRGDWSTRGLSAPERAPRCH